MPKVAGGEMKTLRVAPSRPLPASRGINHQTPPSAPKVTAMSPGASKWADHLKPAEKKNLGDGSGVIDPRQMRD
jgi:hypothetical protein